MRSDISVKFKDLLLSLFKEQKTKNLISTAFQSEGVLQLLIIIFLLICLISIEFIVGFSLRAFHLMVDSLHNVLNILALIFSLVSTIVAKLPKNQRFTYGYSRLEIISSFANCCFLTFLSLFLVFRSLHDLLEALHEEGEHNHSTGFQRFDLLELFNALRFCLHVVGMQALKKFSVLKEGKNLSKEEYKKDDDLYRIKNVTPSSKTFISPSHYINFHTVYLHFMIGLLTTGTFVCFHFLEFLHRMNADLYLNVGILVYTVIRTKPIFSLATDILLQGLPSPKEDDVDKLLDKVKKVQGVQEINDVHYWALDPNNATVYLKLLLSNYSVKSEVEKEVKSILRDSFTEIVMDITC